MQMSDSVIDTVQQLRSHVKDPHIGVSRQRALHMVTRKTIETELQLLLRNSGRTASLQVQ